jgi:Flp pilus assembly protein TadB
MALTSTQRMILTAIGVGIVVGLVVGGLGAYLGLSVGVLGGLTGALVVVALQYLRRQTRKTSSSEPGDQS